MFLRLKSSLLLMMVLGSAAWVDAVSHNQLYPFGPLRGDLTLGPGDDSSSNEIILQETVAFYSASYRAIYVNINGHVSFDSELPDYRANMAIPFGLPFVAVFLADIDTRSTGRVYYRSTSEADLIERAARDIRANFTAFQNYSPTSLFIVTWDRVGYFREQGDKHNTFQLVLASNGRDSFAFFHYLDNGIQWMTSQGKFMPTYSDIPPQAGFDGGEDSNHYRLPGSGESGSFVNGSNVNIPGVWLFQVGNTGQGNVKPADVNIGEVTLFEIDSGKSNCFHDSSVCHRHAQCIDHSVGVCCVCVPPYVGNGYHCLEPGAPQKLNGPVYGNLNGVALEDSLLMHTYVVTTDGRTYSAISGVPPSLGSALQTLNSIGGIIGWLFALPVGPNAKNGFSFTGGVFNRTSRITFKSLDRGDYVVRIHQIFSGHDPLNNIRLETRLEGSMPDIPIGATVSIDDYNENYKRVAAGTIKSFVARTYRVNDVAYLYSWDNTITYNECESGQNGNTNEVLRFSVSRHYVKHSEQDKVVRYAMTSKVGVFAGADPCSDASKICDENADCVPEGESFRCVCRSGFAGDGRSCEADIRLCGQDICDRNARCVFIRGTHQPQCECAVGFQGDGVTCNAIEASCNEANICAENAECLYDENLRQYYCECMDEFSGDGFSCEPTVSGCSSCDRYAQCVYDTTRSIYACQCDVGYTGDGQQCTLIDVCADCDRNARCLFNDDTGDYECVCVRGYRGDGRTCQLRDCREDPTMCDAEGGICWFDADRNISICRCNYGYRGDGFHCRPTACDVINDCDDNARCVTDGSRFSCQCNEGFTGDGRRCIPQEPSHISGCDVTYDCDANARCVPDDTDPNRYTCNCNPGYHGDGKVCLLRFIPCNQVNNCDRNAECIYDPDILSYTCRCSRGFDGDGLVCVKKEVIDCRHDQGMCSANAECVQGAEEGYVCVCMPRFRGDGTTCSPVVQEGNYLIYAQGNKVMSISSESRPGDYGQQLVFIAGMLAVGVDIDCQEGDVYWTDAAMGMIRRAKLNGSNVETIISGLKSPEGIAIDFAARNLFFTDSELDILQVSRLDGSYRKTLVSTDMTNPRAIVVDINRGVVFWTDWNRSQPQIERINMDGTQRKVLVGEGLKLPNGLAFDTFSQTLCWGDAGTKSIECIRSDGVGRRVVFDQAAYPFDIVALNNIIYWTDWERRDIPNINQSGGETNKPLKQAIGGHGRVYGIAAVKDQCPRARNSCGLNNGGCKFLCLASVNGGRVCSCPDGIDPRICQ
uniref:Nidogen n=1 Tax=Arion vulgaris TaxID=1028688 RepID=A0A0B7B8A8_9EUPU